MTDHDRTEDDLQSIRENLQSIGQSQWRCGYGITLYVDGVARDWRRNAMPKAIEEAPRVATVSPFRPSAS